MQETLSLLLLLSFTCTSKNTLLHISHIINFLLSLLFLFVCLFVVVMAEYNTLAEQCYGTYMDVMCVSIEPRQKHLDSLIVF